MEHRGPPPDDVIVQVNAAAVAAVDERIWTGQITEEEAGIDGGKQIGGGGCLTRRTFSQAYKMRHRNPLVRMNTRHTYDPCTHADRSVQPKLDV